MCEKSDAYDRAGQAQETTVVVGTGDTALIPYAGNRIAIVISCPVTNRITITAQGAAVDLAGIVLYPGGAPFKANIKHEGALATKALRAIASVAQETITVTEIFR